MGAVVVIALLVGGAFVLLRGDDQGGGGPGASPSASPTTSYFTGERGENGPVIGVKIDNVRAARPQTGLDSADIVYVEPVEGGLTRLLAIFSGTPPETVGPVRSARESDLELLRQFGRPALAYSGASSAVLPLIREAPVVDLSPANAGAAYRRTGDRSAPHNLLADYGALQARAGDADPPRDIGFRFGPPPQGGDTAERSRTVGYPAASVEFSWSSSAKGWQVAFDGDPVTTTGARRPAPATVVVQRVEVRRSRLSDKLGNASPYVDTVGSGEAVVLRDGRAYEARWSRPSADSGTEFTQPNGARLPFATGKVWIAFTDRPL
ncbi:MAG: DUF3048 domain-containing protein [Streptosporangiales bacterium]|nr:DUF3048 domain-containing protein [Streptosporangiales bacterium]